MDNISEITFDNGDQWEEFCHSCLKIKHQNDNYKSVEANNGGDYGLDGFTTSGIAYQCYCPEKKYSNKELHEHLRDKLRVDITKLKTYKDKLGSLLNGVKIKTWNFTTPRLLTTPDFIVLCNKHENEVKSWNLDFIDTNFEIGIKDKDYFLPEIPVIFQTYNKAIEFKHQIPNSIVIEEFKKENNNNQLVSNVLDKNSKLFPNNGTDYSSQIVRRTSLTIKDYIMGEDLKKQWADILDREFERFLRLLSALEQEVEIQSTLPIENKSEKINQLKANIVDKLGKEFPKLLNEADKERLAASIIADWLMRCPLDFI